MVYTSALIVITGMVFVVSGLAWRRRRVPGANPFIGLAVAATIWTAGNALELMVEPPDLKILFARIQYFGIVSVGCFWLLFILEYTRQTEILTRRGRLLIWLVPVIILLLVWTNDFHGLVWTDISPRNPRSGAPLVYSHGPGFWLLVCYSYGLILTGSAVLIRTIRLKPHLYRKQAITLLVAVSIPWIGNLLYLTGNTPIPGFDLTPPAFLISTFALGWSLFSFRLLELPPLARDVIMENMMDGILVVDMRYRLADMNNQIERMFNIRRDEFIGRPVWDILPETELLTDSCCKPGATPIEIEISHSAPRSLELRSAQLDDSKGSPVGHLVILRDITERKQQQAMLHAQQDALAAADRDRRRLIESEAVAEERNRIAQEIHDGLAQNLAALRMRITLWRDYARSQPEKMLEELDEVEAMVAGSLLEARRSIYALRPPALSGQGFFPALRRFIKGINEYYTLDVSLEVAGNESSMPTALELTVFRVIQEALNNTARHAEARHAAIRIDLSAANRLTVTIADDGRGFNPLALAADEAAVGSAESGEADFLEGGSGAESTHFGLHAMRERVEAAHGKFFLEAAPGRGTCLRIVFPRPEPTVPLARQAVLRE